MEPQTGVPDNLTGTELVMALNKMEDEHLRLQRQFRMIQTDRNNRTVGVHPQFRRQDHLLKTLKNEYINLVLNLKLARSGAHKKKDKKMKKDLKASILFIMKSINESDSAENLMEELNGLIHLNVKKVLQLREAVTASNGALLERRTESEQRLLSTENKLETAMLRFNVIQHENKELRESIEHMLKDRARFNQSWTRMLTALGKGKKFLTDLFESSTVAYDQRDEWVTKLRRVQEKGMMEQVLQVQMTSLQQIVEAQKDIQLSLSARLVEFERRLHSPATVGKEMRELQNSLDNEMRLHDFLYRKGMKRVNRREEQREQEQKIKEEEDAEKLLKEQNDALGQIYKYTDMYKIEDIINKFKNSEHDNYSIYKLLICYCAENQVLSRELRLIQRELLDRKDWNAMMSIKRQQHLDNLEQELVKQQLETEERRNKVKDQEKFIDENLTKIGEIFKMLDCSLEPYQNLLGDKNISIWQLNLTLNLITEKIKDLVQAVCFHERHHVKKPTSSMRSRLKKYVVRVVPPEPWTAVSLTDFVPADPCPTCVEARWFSRVPEELERPFTRAEARTALAALKADPAYERSDRLHALTQCRLPHSRTLLARRYAS